MRRSFSALAVFAVLALSLAPGVAEARAGGSASFGSRGGRTFSAPPPTNTAPSFAAPMERSYTPRVAPEASPGFVPAPGYGGGFARPRSAFTSGLLGGLVGAGLGGLLFGHGMFGGFDGVGSFFGFLIQIALLVLVGRWLFRLFARRSMPAFAGMGGGLLRGGMLRQAAAPMGGGGGVGGGGVGGGGGSATRPVSVTPADYAAFEQVLQQVQQAWSAGDLPRLGAVATPEMVGYFNEQLADLSSRGLRNTVTDVRLQKGDLSEAWQENGREYATVAMRFSMVDATRDGAERVVEGSATEHQTATELWTFLRTQGGRWVLSAIQQAR